MTFWSAGQVMSLEEVLQALFERPRPPGQPVAGRQQHPAATAGRTPPEKHMPPPGLPISHQVIFMFFLDNEHLSYLFSVWKVHGPTCFDQGLWVYQHSHCGCRFVAPSNTSSPRGQGPGWGNSQRAFFNHKERAS